MPDILTLLDCLAPYLSAATIRQLSQIIPAIITMSGRVTMLGLSRWTDKGGSYRNIQRFFYSIIPWSQLFRTFFRCFLFNPGVLDLKAHFRGCKHMSETLKLLPQMPEPILMQHIFQSVARLGSIHATPSQINSP